MHPTDSPERWARVQEAFRAALTRAPEERGEFFSALRREDASIALEAQSLVEAHLRVGLLAPLEREPLERVADAVGSRYEVEREVGVGGMATVYLARDRKHDRKVAIKVLGPGFASAIGAQRFLHEIQITAKLQHPHVLPLHDSGESDGILYYVMPYVAEGSLRHRLARDGRLEPADAVSLVRSVAGALDYAARQDIVHRDIKPENILLQDGEPMVADFGIAIVPTEADDARLTAAGFPIGTPTYMSPEQAAGRSDIDHRADQYALACVLYECLAGEPPFRGENVQGIVAQHLTAEPRSVSDLRPGVPAVIDVALRTALAKDRSDRFESTAAFARALESTDVPGPQVGAGRSARTGYRTPRPNLVEDQEIRFCTASDGVTIAYATVGEGPPLVKVANWLSHLEFDWRSPMWRHWWEGLAGRHRLIRYDERGCGLSDWDVPEMSFDTWVDDLESVVDTVGIEEFALLGVSQGGSIAVEYAVRHPERVSRLVIHGSYARGRRVRAETEEDHRRAELEMELIRLGWGGSNPAFRQVFSTGFYPDADPEQLRWLNELQVISSSAENAVRIRQGFDAIDVQETAARVRTPTLVLHCTGDARIPFAEGRRFASLIPGARFVPLDSRNHIPLEDEPAWGQFLDALHDFLDPEAGAERP